MLQMTTTLMHVVLQATNLLLEFQGLLRPCGIPPLRTLEELKDRNGLRLHLPASSNAAMDAFALAGLQDRLHAAAAMAAVFDREGSYR